MTDLQTAKQNLDGHTICLCRGGECLFSEKKGIAPMMGFIGSGADLRGYSVADLVVGKAAAMLFVRSGIKSVFAKTLSKSGKTALEKHGIPVEYETLTESIINRDGTDVCPMEKTVAAIDDPDEAYAALREKIRTMKQ